MAESHDRNQDMPDGISRSHVDRQASSLFVRLLPMLALGALLAFSFTGLLGGTPNPTYRAEAAGASLTASVPRVLRSGEFFEMRFRISAKEPLADAALSIEQSYLRDLTLNTHVPAPEKE